MFDVLTIGSALVDIFISSSDFELQHTGDGIFLCQMYGAKIEVDGFNVQTGGGAGNVAVGLARAGFSVAAIAELGKDSLAKLVLEDLRKDHVDCEYIIHERKEQTGGSVILVGQDGGRTVMVHRGASSQLDPADIPARAIERTSWLHLSSVGGRLATIQHIGAIAARHRRPISWNPGKAELALLAGGELSIAELPTCQILLVNQEEWESVENVQAEMKQTIPEIIVTNGKEGLDIIFEKETQHLPAETSSAAVDETGAGDGFITGYIAARLYQHEPLTACQWGIRNARSVVSQFGAKPGLLRYNELTAQVPAHE